VPPAQIGVEPDPRPAVGQPHPQLDVLHHRRAVGLGVEAAGGHERVTAHRAEPRPERARIARRALVHVVVQQVAEARHGAVRRRVVVIGAEHRGQLGIGGERRADPVERIGVDLNVRVDEDEDLAAREPGAGVAGRRGAVALGDDQDLVVDAGRGLYSRERRAERCGAI
jgi:hypothetical protein